VPAIQECIDSVEPNNPHIWLMANHLNRAYSQKNYEGLMTSNDFFKLSYKGKLDLSTVDGKKTIYAHILEENNVV
jgi:hypothetical protein